MPEGHVIHRLAHHLRETFEGKELRISSPQGRFADEAARLDGAELVGTEAIGKHLFLRFDLPAPDLVHIHLGLIGQMRLEPSAEPRGIVRLRIDDGTTAADLRGPQWCRLVDDTVRDKVFADSGPDPIRPDMDPQVGYDRLRRSGRSVGALLMDQKIAAGVGNIYRAEVLFRREVNPRVPGKEITRKTWQLIYDDLALLMADGTRTGRIDTVRPEHSPEAQERAPREDPHGGEVYVYRRDGQPCLVCGTEVKARVLEGRHLYWCPRCQRRKHAV
ncbi:MAG: Fpg/Nei family DNA glycosylase [Propionibacterium sp.]|nr:Fpg/Nei family DNA glycosylase [Propionibacterium sp.]